jgi:hypothetical protein
MGHDKSTISRVIRQVADALVEMKDTFIKWPQTPEKLNSIKNGQIRFHGIQEGKKYDRWRSCSEKTNFLRGENSYHDAGHLYCGILSY